MLEIEIGDGEARILDAALQTRGPATDGSVACARDVLRGHVIRTRGGEPGSRVRMPFHVTL
jgi:hypothetical protein